MVFELRAYWCLYLAIARKRRVPDGAQSFGYSKGSLTFPTAIVVVSTIELGVVHLLVPWTWLRIVLLVLSVWGVLFIFGLFATRIVHPHIVTDESLQLRWG